MCFHEPKLDLLAHNSINNESIELLYVRRTEKEGSEVIGFFS